MRSLSATLNDHLIGGVRRPEPLADGHVIQGRFCVEQLIFRGVSRHEYRVSCVPGSQSESQCWECGYGDNNGAAAYCDRCGMAMCSREFVLTERWTARTQPFIEFEGRKLAHPNLAVYYAAFEEGKNFYVLTDLQDRVTLSDVAVPLELETLVDLGCGIANALEFLEDSGVRLQTLRKENISYSDGDALLFEPDIGLVQDGPLGPRYRGRLLETLSQILREFVPYNAHTFRELFDLGAEGRLSGYEVFRKKLNALSPENTPLVSNAVNVGAVSDVGLTRSLNEDCWGYELLNDETGLYVVADGMGGHDNGEVASELAVRTLIEEVRTSLDGDKRFSNEMLQKLLQNACKEANNEVKAFSERRRSDMGTTLVAALVYRGSVAYIGNVGDSRGYLYRDGELFQISQDHSLVANLVAMGKIPPEAARNHPHANILIRTVGKEWDVEVDVFKQDVQSGDGILLCSDGLWGEIEDEQISAILGEFPDPREACAELIRAANQSGGRDNITAILLQIP